MEGPWEKYQKPQAEAGPWDKYAQLMPDGRETPPAGEITQPHKVTPAEVATQQQNPPKVPQPPLPAGLQPQPQRDPSIDRIYGVPPAEVGQRLEGVAQSVGNLGLGALQWGQNALGTNVTPTPPSFQPNTPGQKIGSQLGTMAQYAGAAAATGGMSLPAQVGVGGLASGMIANGAGQDPALASKIGMAAPMTAAALGKAVGAAKQYLDDKQYVSAIYNKIARVPAGQRGIQAGEGAAFKTDPGRAMADKGVTAWSAPQLKVESERALGEAGTALTDKLRTATTPMDVKPVINTELPQIQAALKEVGIDPMPVTQNELGGLSMAKPKPMQQLIMTPEQAHQFRSKIGDYIDWNPSATINVTVGNNPNMPLQVTNEELKNSYFAINKMIDGAIDGVKPLNKAWQESYLYTKALTDRIERLHGTQFGMPGSTMTGMANRYMFSAPTTKIAQLLKKAQDALGSNIPGQVMPAAQGALQGAMPQQ